MMDRPESKATWARAGGTEGDRHWKCMLVGEVAEIEGDTNPTAKIDERKTPMFEEGIIFS